MAPDDESLADIIERRRNQQTTTPDENRARCPDCHTTSISMRNGDPRGTSRAATNYYCTDCGLDFDEPYYPRDNQ